MRIHLGKRVWRHRRGRRVADREHRPRAQRVSEPRSVHSHFVVHRSSAISATSIRRQQERRRCPPAAGLREPRAAGHRTVAHRGANVKRTRTPETHWRSRGALVRLAASRLSTMDGGLLNLILPRVRLYPRSNGRRQLDLLRPVQAPIETRTSGSYLSLVLSLLLDAAKAADKRYRQAGLDEVFLPQWR